MKRDRTCALRCTLGAVLASLLLSAPASDAAAPRPGPPPSGRLKLPPQHLAKLQRSKKRADPAALRQAFFTRNRLPFVRVRLTDGASKDMPLIPGSVVDRAPAASEAALARKVPDHILKYRNYYTRVEPASRLFPNVVDHRSRQSPVKDQDGRATAGAFGAIACLEALPHIPDDLSEQHAYHLYMTANRRVCTDNQGTHTLGYPRALRLGVCEERFWPYQTMSQLTADWPLKHRRDATRATLHPRYRIRSYFPILGRTETGVSIRNPRFLEMLLARGYDIVYDGWVTHWGDGQSIIDVQIHPSTGQPVPGQGGHCMLLVGYNRPRQHFIVKNSWSTRWGHNGYGHFSYDYIKTYAMYGYVVLRAERTRPAVFDPRKTKKAIPINIPGPIKRIEPRKKTEPIRKK